MLNSVIIKARIGKDLDLLKTGSGRSYVHIRLACDRSGTGYGDREKITDWLDATAWGKTAEFICKYFRKGDYILIEGSLHSTQWKDRNGNNKYGVEINVDNADFCGSKRHEGSAAPAGGGIDVDSSGFTELDNDGTQLPFSMGEDESVLPWNEELPL